MCNEKYVLDKVNTGIKMGMDSISTISEKVGDDDFKNNLKFQYDRYNEILNKVDNELTSWNEFPSELPVMQKMMGFFDIQMSTIKDKSNSHLTEMLLKGYNMGIIAGVKLKNENPDIKPEVQEILEEFIVFQQNTVEKLKEYL